MEVKKGEKTGKKILAAGLVGLVLLALSFVKPRQAAARRNASWTGTPDSAQQIQMLLSSEDKDEIGRALRLKADTGNQVWPGLAEADIPIILFNGGYEFLIGEINPPGPWEVVKGDDFQGQPYYRRVAADSQYFALKVNSHWAGSMGTLELMNKKGPLRLSPEFHIVLLLHEVFHAFEADRAPLRFAKALAAYRAEGRYPAKDQDFATAWTSEGAALAQALKAADNAQAVGLARRFLEIRDSRRKKAGLGPNLLDFEREIEWLEGLAKYAEVRFYELAAMRPTGGSPVQTKPALHPILQWDFVRLERQLGTQEGDLRFYLSGLAQARLLDRLSPGWKSAVPLDKVYLEDLLRGAIASIAF